MDPQRLDRLFRRLIIQQEYPGGTCPTEQKQVELIRGELSEQERQRMDEHLKLCAGCREDTRRLGKAALWFREHGSQIYAGVRDKGAAAGVEPWADCLHRDLLKLLATESLPDTEAGRTLRRRLEGHVESCACCRQAVDDLRRAMASMTVIHLTELQQGARKAADVARRLLLAMQTMAMARGTLHQARAMPGFRSQPQPTVSALMLDPGFNLVLDEAGNPRQVDFQLIRAEVAHDGHCVVDLTTEDRAVREQPEGHMVGLSLEHESTTLVLPAEQVYPDGHVTIVGNVPSGVEIRRIPLSALRLTVMQRASKA
jgi:hypothetical protein